MKSVISKSQFLATLLAIVVVTAACVPATPLPTSTPTSTSTPAPTSTFTPSPTPTETSIPTPTPILVSVIKDTILYEGPSKDGYGQITSLTAGINVEPLAKFVDFVLARWHGADKTWEGYVPAVMLRDVPQDLPILTTDQVPWKILKNVVTPDKPIERQNNSNSWASQTLARNIKFSDALRIKLNEEVAKGGIGIVIRATGEGNPWWKGQKRIEFFYEDGNLHILVRDGTQEQEIYSDFIPLQTTGGITTGELILAFDQFGKNLKVIKGNEVVSQIIFADIGDFPDGLFSKGQILNVELSLTPKSNGKLIELIFLVPPDGKYK
jgi:hypothetical protein